MAVATACASFARQVCLLWSVPVKVVVVVSVLVSVLVIWLCLSFYEPLGGGNFVITRRVDFL